MPPCDSRQLQQSQREDGFSQLRNAGVQKALRPYTGKPTVEGLADYINKELYEVVRAGREAVNQIFRPVLDNAPSGNPLRYFFSDSTVNADPTAGRLRLDNADATAASVIRVSESNAGLQNVIPWLDTMSGSSTTPLGVVTLFHVGDPTRFARYDLTAMTDQGTYWDLTLSFIEASHTTPFRDGDGVVLAFLPGVSSSGAVPIGANQVGLVSHVGGNSVASVSRIAFSNASNVTWSLSTAASAATVLGSVALQTGISAWRLSNMAGSQTGSITNATDTIVTSGTIFVEAATDTLNSINNVKFRLSGNSLFGAAAIGAIAGTLPVTSGFAQAFVLSNSNNVSFGASTLALAGVGRLVAITGTATVASTQGSIRLSAGTTSVLSSAFTFSNSNNVSFGMDTNGVVTGTATVASSLTNIRVSAGTTSTLASAFTFQNSNAISFGLNGAVITAIANSGISAVGGGTLSVNNGLSGLAFLDSNNVSWTLSTNAGTPGNGTIIASATVASTQGSIRISAGTTSVLSSGFTFSNSNNVSFGINAGVVTATATVASTQGSIQISAGTTNALLSQLSFSNRVSTAGTNGVTFGLSGSTITAQVAPAIVRVVGGTVDFTGGSVLSFVDSNNISFGGSSVGSVFVLTASVNAGGGGIAMANSGVTASTGTVQFSNATILTNGAASANLPNVVFGLTGQTMQGTALIRVQTGTNSTLSGGFQVTKVQFADANGISFGMASTNDADGRVAVVTARTEMPVVSIAGVVNTFNTVSTLAFVNYPMQTAANVVSIVQPEVGFWRNWVLNAGVDGTGNNKTIANNSLLWVQPLDPKGPFPGVMTLNTFYQMFHGHSHSSTQSTGAFTFTLRGGLYGKGSNSTHITLLNSFSTTFAAGAQSSATRNSSHSGRRWISVHSSLWSSQPVVNLGQNYWYAFQMNTAGVNQYSAAVGQQVNGAALFQGLVGSNGTDANGVKTGIVPFHGLVSTNSGALPSSIGTANLLNLTASSGQIDAQPILQAVQGVALV